VATPQTLLTADELLRLPHSGQRHELVRGELRTMPPAGGDHGLVAMEIGGQLRDHVKPRRLGYVSAAEAGFRIHRDPDTVLAPDAAFVALERLPERPSLRGFVPLVPDLVVEVVSLFDTATEVEEKVQAWLAAGARMVWVVHPRTRSVTVYRSPMDVRVLKEADELDGTPVLPEFRCPVRDLFPS
jgi:Uma2 family endonuclease